MKKIEPKYYGDRACARCGSEIPYGKKYCDCKPKKKSLHREAKNRFSPTSCCCQCCQRYHENKTIDKCLAWQKQETVRVLVGLKQKQHEWSDNNTYNIVNAFNQRIDQAIEKARGKK